MAKKVFFTFLIVFVLAFVGLAVKKFVLDKDAAKVATDGSGDSSATDKKQTGSEKESVANQNLKSNGKFSLIMSGRNVSATLDAQGTKVLFFQGSEIVSMDFNGDSKVSLVNYDFGKVETVDWSPDKTKAIVKSDSGFFLVNIFQGKVQKLKNSLDVVRWAPSSEKIIYKYYVKETKQRTLDMANPDGLNWKTLAKIPYRYADVSVSPKGERACFFQMPDSIVSVKMECFDYEGGNSLVLQQGVFGADYLWSPFGKKVLASYMQEKLGNKLSLSVMNAQGGELVPLNFSTSVKKCVWAKDEVSVYCAIIAGISDEAKLPEDWSNGKVFSVDTFWKINTENGKKERLVDIDQIPGELDAVNLFLSDDGLFLFFIDKKTGGIYKVKI